MDPSTDKSQAATRADDQELKQIKQKLVKVKRLRRDVHQLLSDTPQRRQLESKKLIQEWETLKKEVEEKPATGEHNRRPSVLAIAKQKKSADLINKIEQMIAASNVNVAAQTPHQPAPAKPAPPAVEKSTTAQLPLITIRETEEQAEKIDVQVVQVKRRSQQVDVLPAKLKAAQKEGGGAPQHALLPHGSGIEAFLNKNRYELTLGWVGTAFP
jgi:hypothetical protein